MEFLNHREGIVVFYQVFLLNPLQYFTVEIGKRLREFEEIEISRQSCCELKE
jgi:hypothetical protein